MKLTKLSLIAILAVSAAVAGGEIKPAAETSSDKGLSDIGIFNNIKYNGELRPRYENVDDSVNEEAKAATIRFALGAGANLGGIEGLSIFGQMMAVTNFGYDEYAPEQKGYAVIADPELARITQAYVDYKMDSTLFRLGRQMVNIDDERFVGAVGWRQMPQTFTAYTVTNNSIKNLGVMASYVTDRHGVTDALSGGTETVLLHADYKLMPELKLTGYGYLIGSSSNTYGAMATGKVGMINYIAEAATQQDASLEYDDAGKPTVDAMYYRLDVNTKYNGIILGAAYESLGEADGNAHGFTTPLATLHKWQGFADVFVGYTGGGTNTYGLNDAYGKIGYADPTYGTLVAFYHSFSAIEQDPLKPELGDNAGSEIDLVYTYDFSKDLSFMAKAAFFSGDEDSVITVAQNDKDVFWVMMDYKF